MKTSIPFLLFLLIFLGCKDETNSPSGPEENKATGYFRSYVNGSNWEASEIYASREGTVINLSARKSNSEIQIQIINVNQPGTYSIGENEPGFTYFIKAKYIDKTQGDNKTYSAYSRNYSIFDIKNISEGFLDADFVFIAYDSSFTDSVKVSNGSININY